MVCMKWLIEGILDKPIIEAAICLSLCIFLLVDQQWKIKRAGIIWVPFIFNIVLSLTIHDSSFGIWGRGAITICTVCFALLIDIPVERYKSVCKFLITIGIFTAILVMLQYFAGEIFDKIYYPMLTEKAKQSFSLYKRKGYYFGLLYNPHEPAGLITFGIAGLILWKYASKAKGYLIYFIAFLMAIPLLLTGKKGVLFIAVVALGIMILVLHGSRRHWLKALRFVTIIIAAVGLLVYLALKHPEIAILNRLRLFFVGLMAGDSIDSGRLNLYRMALSEWKGHELLGIGWRHFNALTVEKYRMTQYHEVNCDYLQWLCETGIIGFVLSIIPVGIMLYRTFFVCRRLIQRARSKTETWVLLFAGLIQIFTFIYAFVEIPFFDIVFFAVYVFSCIVINSAYVRRREVT